MDNNAGEDPLKDEGFEHEGQAALQGIARPFCMGHVLNNMFNCFSGALGLLGSPDLKPGKAEEDWEVPIDSITNMVLLGSGAQGIVYSGLLRGEIVAVKKLRDASETNIKHLRKLNHENIVRFRGVCTSPTFAVIMEYCQYGPLFEFLHSGTCFPPKNILKWSKEIARGMEYLHQNKIIHRDLKSPNILIADNLTVKVSDFGTSREWNDVSAIMSFTGTVAWMAPEVIRHEPCSERVDVWSYGVVLWELFTQEVPYKNMESHAIMWGVGTDSIKLPIPSTCPNSLQTLLQQCWNRVPRNRPPFKIIVATLEMTGDELTSIEGDCFNATQESWRKEIEDTVNKFQVWGEGLDETAPLYAEHRRDQLRATRDLKLFYEQKLSRANEMILEACTVQLQLEQREQAVSIREQALKACRCGVRKPLKLSHWHTSSSSDDKRDKPKRHAHKQCQKMQHTPQIMVKLVEDSGHQGGTVTMKLEDLTCDCTEDSVHNNNINNINTVKAKANVVVEKNGNGQAVQV